MRRCAAAVVAVVVGVGLASCSSGSDSGTAAATSSRPAVCGSADELRTSLSALQDVKVVEDGTDALNEAWTTVRSDWAQLADDARGQYAEQVDGVQADADTVRPPSIKHGPPPPPRRWGARPPPWRSSSRTPAHSWTR
jgi:hypothetical protein